MAFPPNFLEEIRARVGLADLISRRVRLVRKGREFMGLCPFHNEKSPSFSVVEDKGFFHCFGCGAHGDAIGFIMRTEGLSFPEAVERLAGEAGLEMPAQTPAERETARREADLYEALEAACRFYEERLRHSVGKTALAYLKGRGLDDATIARFRLGYAPDGRSALKTALMGTRFPERLLVEAGLMISPDEGRPAYGPGPFDEGPPEGPLRATYDRFRGRVAFPITDRRGRVIAFGARMLGEGQPKYLNSPETPVFHKGRVLYGLAQARKAAHGKGRIVVVEGYMDVIGMSRAGFEETVAPLGTALTETHLQMLWRLAAEPILCFDGDEAGWRAAVRAAERALPVLTAGHSLRFITLPKGEDPDTFVAARGRPEMEKLLKSARPLNELIWQAETTGQALDTPERLAALETRLEERARAIPDRKVQFQYLGLFRQKLRDMSWAARSKTAGYGRSQGRGQAAAATGGRGRAPAPPSVATGGPRSRPDTHRRDRLADCILLATVLNHPALLGEFAATLGKFNLEDPTLDRLRREILLLFAERPTLDADAFARHLMAKDLAAAVGEILGSDVLVHAGFARPDSPLENARAGFRQTLLRRVEPARRAAVAAAARAFGEDPTEANWSEFERLKAASSEDDLSVEARQAEFEAQIEPRMGPHSTLKSRTRGA